MQTIKVNINTTPSETTFKINGHTVADIHAYSGEHHAEAFCAGMDWVEAKRVDYGAIYHAYKNASKRYPREIYAKQPE